MAPPTRRLRDDETRARDTEELQVDPEEKDEVELQLERLLFGDEASFLDSLAVSKDRKSIALTKSASDKDVVSEDVEFSGMGDLPDEELFFLDAGSNDRAPKISQGLEDEHIYNEEHEKKPVWVDSDDERMIVSLASNSRLRKLRDNEADDIVSGTEYMRRLRRQYERLHPVPEWVKYAYKRRKLSNEEARSDSDSDYSIDDRPASSSVQSLSELLRTGGGNLTRNDSKSTNGRTTRRLRPEVVDIQRLKDVAGSGPSSIDTMQFHPSLPLLLSGGPSSTLNLYHVSPQPPNPNPIVTSLHLRNTPLHTAAFCCSPSNPGSGLESSQNGTRVFVSSRRRYFHTWSLTTGAIQKVSTPIYGSGKHEQKTMESFKLSPCGRYMGLVGSGKKGGGLINVLSTETMQWICSCRIDSQGGVADFSWWRDGNGFAVVGKNGEVSEYDVEQKRVICRWLDEGAVGTTVIALGGETSQSGPGSSRWVAIGSSSGIVNVYDRKDWSGGADDDIKTPLRPKPARALDQLTTPTSHLEFSNDGQMMVMGSRWKRDALRLVHLPSCTVYRNWPTDKTPLGRISSIALSMDGGYLAVANEQGKIRLFQVRD